MMKKMVVSCLLTLFSLGVMAQSASISPSRFYFKQAPGESGIQLLRVTNNGEKPETFQISFANFDSEGNQGKTSLVDDDFSSGCAHWLSATPAFFEVAPGETKDVEIRIQVPSTPEALSVRWATGQVRLASERSALNERGADVTGMQIIQTFQFLFHVFQTPPALQDMKEASVLSFQNVTEGQDAQVTLLMEVENSGTAIVDCVPYLDVLNTVSGETERIMNKPFSILPGGKRMVRFLLPEAMAPGPYNILGVIDYGSRTDLAGAELNIVVD
ncbi:fimbrial biogenesis chaperone [Geofilum rubicundum]|uniref:Fn3-like domain-containing protein n=1 Tax=Geofilum rubicundum JCM 15548 TaxID=1236989 RepID=A0A0E9LXZ2_9BACT|nr:hypothetical protein [Geofilum rubicundum]GAO29745.1 hypothetical protein JCM15548_11966 [Geofilum rubicundum JCM 15548]